MIMIIYITDRNMYRIKGWVEMELGQIRYFIVAAQFQNLSKAAHILNITQPALSKSISKLEEELGVLLFDRSGKRVELNEYGERFLEYVTNSMQELDDAIGAVKNQVSSPALYLGVLHYSDKFMRCLGAFSVENPNVSIQLERLDIASNDLDTNKYDMLLYPQNQFFRKYKGDMVYSDPYVMAVHRSNTLVNMKSVRLSDAADQRIVFMKYSNKLFDLPYHMCVSLDINLGGCIFTNSHEVQKWLIANNVGVCFVPQGGAEPYASDPQIEILPVDDEDLRQDIMIGFKREKHLSVIGKQFASFVSDYFGLE